MVFKFDQLNFFSIKGGRADSSCPDFWQLLSEDFWFSFESSFQSGADWNTHTRQWRLRQGSSHRWTKSSMPYLPGDHWFCVENGWQLGETFCSVWSEINRIFQDFYPKRYPTGSQTTQEHSWQMESKSASAKNYYQTPSLLRLHPRWGHDALAIPKSLLQRVIIQCVWAGRDFSSLGCLTILTAGIPLQPPRTVLEVPLETAAAWGSKWGYPNTLPALYCTFVSYPSSCSPLP